MRLTPDQTAVCLRVARTVARTYSRRYHWLSEDDLQQEAWTAMLPKLADFDASKGELGAYLHQIATNGCKRFAWRLSAVANVPRRTAAMGEAKRQRTSSVDESALALEAAPEPLAEAQLEAAEERERLALILAQHLAAGREGEAVMAVLTGAMKSAEAAETHGVPLARLYRLTHQTRESLRADRRLQRFA